MQQRIRTVLFHFWKVDGSNAVRTDCRINGKNEWNDFRFKSKQAACFLQVVIAFISKKYDFLFA